VTYSVFVCNKNYSFSFDNVQFRKNYCSNVHGGSEIPNFLKKVHKTKMGTNKTTLQQRWWKQCEL